MYNGEMKPVSSCEKEKRFRIADLGQRFRFVLRRARVLPAVTWQPTDPWKTDRCLEFILADRFEGQAL